MNRIALMALALAAMSCDDAGVAICDLPICAELCDPSTTWCHFENNPSCPILLACEPLGDCAAEVGDRCSCVPEDLAPFCGDFDEAVQVHTDPPPPVIRWEPSPSPVF